MMMQNKIPNIIRHSTWCHWLKVWCKELNSLVCIQVKMVASDCAGSLADLKVPPVCGYVLEARSSVFCRSLVIWWHFRSEVILSTWQLDTLSRKITRRTFLNKILAILLTTLYIINILFLIDSYIVFCLETL